jgi:hypothetical protein
MAETAASTKGMYDLEIGVLSPADADRRDFPYLRVASLIIEVEGNGVAFRKNPRYKSPSLGINTLITICTRKGAKRRRTNYSFAPGFFFVCNVTQSHLASGLFSFLGA